MPAIGDFLSRLTYTTCYAVSYGVVFPTLLVVRAVPKHNVLVQGLIDGARAAQARAADYWDESGSSEVHRPETHTGIIIPGGMPANPVSEAHAGIIIPGSEASRVVPETRQELIIPDNGHGM